MAPEQSSHRHGFSIPRPDRLPRLRFGDRSLTLQKWAGMGLFIGLASGVAAMVFLWAIDLFADLFLKGIAGYAEPTENGLAFRLDRWWALPLAPALGGLVGGWLVWKFAPDAAGIGTDHAIKAFHEGKTLPMKTTLLKLLTSAITIGSGGTSGREGPIAQIGAGTGSWLARRFNLSRRDRNLALAAGLGAGISAIFRAPLAGALISAEVFYREDFEVEAIVPSVLASVVSYSLVGFFFGFEPIFSVEVDRFRFGHPATLLFYVVLGLLCAVAARFAIRIFFPVERWFKRMPLYVATTLGGVLVGIMALLLLETIGFPSSLGAGHPWLQAALLQDPDLYAGGKPVMVILLVAALAEVIGTTLTLGSGGSGGVFGPSLVTGGFLGAAFGIMMQDLAPGLVPNPTNYAIVGMIAYFAAAAKAPMGTLVMVVEMTGGYGLLAPAMVAVIIAYVLSGSGSLFRHQVKDRLASPAHAAEFEPLVLRETRVQDVLPDESGATAPDTPIADCMTVLTKTEAHTLPIVEDGKLLGVVTLRDLRRVPEWDREARVAADVMTTDLATASPRDTLFTVLSTLLDRNLHSLPVVDRGIFVGMVGSREIALVIRGARKQAQENRDQDVREARGDAAPNGT